MSAPKLIDRYPVILLDMNGTFMFGEDRFGAEEDFFASYRALGGRRLTATQVRETVLRCYAGMARDYEDPACYENFPSLAQGLVDYGGAAPADVDDLTAVFAHHELGRIPPRHADYIRRLAVTHRLGLVANIWAPKAPWLQELQRAGVLEALQCLVFSSDGRAIKPAPRLYAQALEGLGARAQDTLFVGDSLQYDMLGAKAAACTTVWLQTAPHRHAAVDYVIPSLLTLHTLEL